jgi:hypothetical protein
LKLNPHDDSRSSTSPFAVSPELAAGPRNEPLPKDAIPVTAIVDALSTISVPPLFIAQDEKT